MPMRAGDVAGLAFSALARHKVRTALTVLGVAIGTFALVASLAIGVGVDRAVVSLFRGTDALRQIEVYVNYDTVPPDDAVPLDLRQVEGVMSDAKRERLRRDLVKNWGRQNVTRTLRPLDSAAVAELERLPHVERVVPYIGISGWAVPVGADPESRQDVTINTVSPDRSYVGRLVAGRPFTAGDRRAVIVHELLLYRWGITDEAAVEAMLGRSIRLESQAGATSVVPVERLLGWLADLDAEEAKALARLIRRVAPLVRLAPLPETERRAFAKLLARFVKESPKPPPEAERIQEDFTLVGVVRSPDPDEPSPLSPAGHWYREAEVILPPAAARAFFLRDPANAKAGFNQAVVLADDQAHVEALGKAIEAAGFRQYSLIQMITTIRLNVTLITLAVTFVAVVALAVAALGITNTMIMSVLERTHEIGIMKALGAREGQLRGIFLVEGACIGVVGGLLGLLAAWAASFPGDAVARAIMQEQTPRPIEESLFAFAPWLTLGAPVLAAVVTTIAAVYPAHRAAKVDPITSLRHE